MKRDSSVCPDYQIGSERREFRRGPGDDGCPYLSKHGDAREARSGQIKRGVAVQTVGIRIQIALHDTAAPHGFDDRRFQQRFAGNGNVNPWGVETNPATGIPKTGAKSGKCLDPGRSRHRRQQYEGESFESVHDPAPPGEYQYLTAAETAAGRGTVSPARTTGYLLIGRGSDWLAIRSSASGAGLHRHRATSTNFSYTDVSHAGSDNFTRHIQHGFTRAAPFSQSPPRPSPGA